jgi:hypothetical protein
VKACQLDQHKFHGGLEAFDIRRPDQRHAAHDDICLDRIGLIA